MNRSIHILYIPVGRWLTAIMSILIMTAYDAHAKGFYVSGSVRDAFTNAGIEEASVVILSPDSMKVSSTFAKVPYTTTSMGNGYVNTEKDNTRGAEFRLEVPEDGEYIISVNILGYEPENRKIEIKRQRGNRPLDIGDIYLIPKSKELDELTVTATKLKVYHKGDTLIYDANAFITDNHNVLEDLVKRLPGVEMRDGRVFVNGRFVDNIVIGGKDFMKSDPKQLMAMLPAYVVDKLKFYDKSGERSETMGKDMHDSSYVMDITMKRDYHGAWLGNLDIGAGTEKRWGGVGMAMYYDERQALSLSIDANNLGLERMATDVATMIDDSSNIADLKNMQAAIGYSYHPSDKIRLDTNAKAKKTDKKEGTDEIFTSEASNIDRIMRQSSRDSDLRNYLFNGDVSMTWRPKKGVYTRVSYTADYGKEDGTESLQSLTGKGDGPVPDSVFTGLLLPMTPMESDFKDISNVYRDLSSSNRRSWKHLATAESQIATGANLLSISGKFTASEGHLMNYRDFISRIFAETMEETVILNLFDTHTNNYSAEAKADFDINYADDSSTRGILTPYYSFEWISNDDDRIIYDGHASDPRQPENIDAGGSRRITGRTWRHSVGAGLKHEFQISRSETWMMLSARLGADFERKDIDCASSGNRSGSTRNFMLLSPELSLRWHPKANDRRGSKSSLELKCRMTQKAPSVGDLADYTDNSDPMNILTGNPDLKKQTELYASLGFRHYFESSKSSLYATIEHTDTWNTIAIKSFYDMETGIRTLMPVNASEGRRMSVDMGYGIPISRNQAWWLNIAARGSLTRSSSMTVFAGSDSDIPYTDFGSYLTRLTVRKNPMGSIISGSYAATYQGNIITNLSFPGSNPRSLMQDLKIDLKLPADVSVTASCNIISRFGYRSSSLDRTVFLLNASIQKSVLNNSLNFSLSAVDILRQRKNVYCVMDASGITESVRTRFTPSYIMLSIYYQWAHTPKKK